MLTTEGSHGRGRRRTGRPPYYLTRTAALIVGRDFTPRWLPGGDEASGAHANGGSVHDGFSVSAGATLLHHTEEQEEERALQAQCTAMRTRA